MTAGVGAVRVEVASSAVTGGVIVTVGAGNVAVTLSADDRKRRLLPAVPGIKPGIAFPGVALPNELTEAVTYNPSVYCAWKRHVGCLAVRSYRSTPSFTAGGMDRSEHYSGVSP